MGYILVFLGAGIGGACRHGVNVLAARFLGTGGFPLGTLAVNVLGSFIMGVFAEVFALRGGIVSAGLRLFLTTGILGGFTTFSTFSLETVLLYERGELGAAAAYVLASVVLAVGGLFAAMVLVRLLLPAGP